MKKKHCSSGGLTIDYAELGTISIDELKDAVIEDIQALKDIYNIRFVKGPRLRMYPTNEYGEPVRVTRPAGGMIDFMDTHHYRPACKDYDLQAVMRSYLTGKQVDKEGALKLLGSMNINWTKRQIDWTAEPDCEGRRKWPWFKDPSNGKLLIDEGFIRHQYNHKQMQSLNSWLKNEIK